MFSAINANNQSKFPNHAHQTNTDNNNHAVNEPSAQSSVQKPAHIAEQNKPIIYINIQLVTTKNVHIRQCPSKKYCASIGIVPNQRTVLVMPDKNRNMNYYEDGWFFVEYSGHFCFLHNYNQQGCHLWNENIRVNGWIYHEGLSELRTPNNQ